MTSSRSASRKYLRRRSADTPAVVMEKREHSRDGTRYMKLPYPSRYPTLRVGNNSSKTRANGSSTRTVRRVRVSHDIAKTSTVYGNRLAHKALKHARKARAELSDHKTLRDDLAASERYSTKYKAMRGTYVEKLDYTARADNALPRSIYSAIVSK